MRDGSFGLLEAISGVLESLLSAGSFLRLSAILSEAAVALTLMPAHFSGEEMELLLNTALAVTGLSLRSCFVSVFTPTCSQEALPVDNASFTALWPCCFVVKSAWVFSGPLWPPMPLVVTLWAPGDILLLLSSFGLGSVCELKGRSLGWGFFVEEECDTAASTRLNLSRTFFVSLSLSFSRSLSSLPARSVSLLSGDSCLPSLLAGFRTPDSGLVDEAEGRGGGLGGKISPSVSSRLCSPSSQRKASLRYSECCTSRLCFLRGPPSPPVVLDWVSGEPSFSADCTRLRRGDRGGSALLGLGRTTGGEEWSFAGKDWVVLELPTVWPGMGGGEDWVGEGVCASGERGMLPADLHRAERYWRWSFGERPCRELGLICWDGAGELGVLEAGELLCEEAPNGPETETNYPGEQFQQNRFRNSWCVNTLFPTSYPGMNAQGWSDGPESVTEQTSCELESQEDSR